MSGESPAISRHALSHISCIRNVATPGRVRRTKTTTIQEQRRHVERPRYAYFTLVMCGDEYAVGAAVLGWSLRNQGVEHELVVMVTPDVTTNTRKLLMKIYDRVERVKYISSEAHSALRGRKYQHEKSWMKYCLTKANLFKFVEYDKIIWMDADMLALSNPDILFQLNAPAGICSSIRDDERWHGELIPEQEIKESILNNYGVKGCIMVLEPSTRHYLIFRSQQETGHQELYLGPDEYFFSMLYKSSWHHLSHKFGCNAVHQLNGTEPVVLHFEHAKPWKHGKDSEWSGVAKWWETATNLYAKHVEFKTLLPSVADRTTNSRPWLFLSAEEKISYKLKNDYRKSHTQEDIVSKGKKSHNVHYKSYR